MWGLYNGEWHLHNVDSMSRLKYFARGKVGWSYLASSRDKNMGEFCFRQSRKFPKSHLLHVNNPFGFHVRLVITPIEIYK
jgi:hypothetical protein